MFLQFNYISRMKKGGGKWVKQDVKAAAKATIGYNAHRVDREKQRMERQLFGHGGKLTEEQALQMIDEATKNTYFFRMILSPDPNSENKDRNTDQWQLTKDLVEWLEAKVGGRDIPFIATEHNDHTDIPHIHAILLLERFGREKMITVPIIKDMKNSAAGKALKQQLERLKAKPFVKQQAVTPMIIKAEDLVIPYHQPPPLCDDCQKPLKKGHSKECERNIELHYDEELSLKNFCIFRQTFNVVCT